MNSDKIKPRTLAGTLELLPNDQIVFNNMLDIIKESYEKFGFLPLDTPIIELSEILLAKAGGETEKQIYRFNKGDNDLSLRFDLTVPLAKYASLYQNELAFPFRRYQIGKVYRGERPQKFRYREFYQCDVDIISDKLNVLNDAEMINVIYTTFKALNIDKFTVCINNRKILNGLFESLKIESDEKVEVMRIIDKVDKIGVSAMKEELLKIGLTSEDVDVISDFIQTSGSTDEKLEKLKNLNITNEVYCEGLDELEKVAKYTKSFGVPEEFFKIDLKIARGLDYYTGTVYETFFDNHRDFGSVCSGGRYDNLTEYYTDRKLKGVGVSIGLTRLYDQLRAINLIKSAETSVAKALVIPMDENCVDFSIKVTNFIRENNINTEIYANFDKDMKSKMKYADKLNIPYCIIVGENEVNENCVMLKNMNDKNQEKLKVEEIIDKIR